MVIDLKNHRRLAVINALKGTFQPEAFPAGVDLMKHVRLKQPDIVLLFMGKYRYSKALKSCRWMKTDIRPVKWVGLINADGPHQDPNYVFDNFEADGYWEGPVTPQDLLEFTNKMVAGKKPFVNRGVTVSTLSRIFGRSF